KRSNCWGDPISADRERMVASPLGTSLIAASPASEFKPAQTAPAASHEFRKTEWRSRSRYSKPLKSFTVRKCLSDAECFSEKRTCTSGCRPISEAEDSRSAQASLIVHWRLLTPFNTSAHSIAILSPQEFQEPARSNLLYFYTQFRRDIRLLDRGG